MPLPWSPPEKTAHTFDSSHRRSSPSAPPPGHDPRTSRGGGRPSAPYHRSAFCAAANTNAPSASGSPPTNRRLPAKAAGSLPTRPSLPWPDTPSPRSDQNPHTSLGRPPTPLPAYPPPGDDSTDAPARRAPNLCLPSPGNGERHASPADNSVVTTLLLSAATVPPASLGSTPPGADALSCSSPVAPCRPPFRGQYMGTFLFW